MVGCLGCCFDELVKNPPMLGRRVGGCALSLADVEWYVGGGRLAAFGGAEAVLMLW